MSSDGTKATTVWSAHKDLDLIVQTRSATISGNTATWGPVTDLSVALVGSAYPQVALSSDGTKATAVWYRHDGSNYIVQAASMIIEGHTPTPTPTPTPSETPTSTSTMPPTPTSTATATPTSNITTPLPDPGKIRAIALVDRNPAEAVLVYVKGAATCITDAQGACDISDLEPRKVYQVQVQKTGVVFLHPQFSIAAGQQVTVNGNATKYNPKSCKESAQSAKLHRAAEAARKIASWATADFYRLNPSARVKMDNGRIMAAAFLPARVESQFANYLNSSAKHPEMVLNCTGMSGCAVKKLKSWRSSMIKELSNIRHEALHANQALRVRGKRSRVASSQRISRIKRRAARAAATLRSLAGQTYECAE